MYNPFSLERKTILITGASSGIGRSVAVECSKMGASVIIIGRNSDRLNETFELLEGETHLQFTADLSNYDEIEQLVERCPKLDGFVNNAGISRVLFVKFIKKEYLNEIIGTNTIAPILLTQLLVRTGKMNKPSCIVFVASLSGVYNVHYGESMFATSMGAINGFSKGAALDLSAQKIRVNCVNPGIIEPDTYEPSGLLSPEELKDKEKFFPLQRFGQPVDVAYAIIYFLSDASSWITGNNLIIDGGYTLK